MKTIQYVLTLTIDPVPLTVDEIQSLGEEIMRGVQGVYYFSAVDVVIESTQIEYKEEESK